MGSEWSLDGAFRERQRLTRIPGQNLSLFDRLSVHAAIRTGENMPDLSSG
jgi:hypothetical protein